MKDRLFGELTFKVAVIFGALLIALLMGAILFGIVGANPLNAYAAMFTRPLQGKFGLTEILVRAAPLMIVALGVAISFRSGILNIGGEGQILIGAIVGAVIALNIPELPRSIHLPLIFLMSFIGGALWGGIAGFMRAYFSVNEILSTVMLNYIAIQIYTFLIRGPMIDPKEIAYGTGVPQTDSIPKHVWLAKLFPGTRLHTGIIVAIFLAVLVYIFLWKTPVGYRMRAVGAEQKAARYAGIKVEKYLVIAMALAGGFAGIAGAVEVCGVHHRGLESISAGYGFSGIVVALFGGLHPLGIIPASVLFGLLIVGADMMQRTVAIPASIIMAIQGLIILAIVGSQVFLTHADMREKLIGLFNLRRHYNEFGK
jgi:simple sugar transport system permease protein